MARKSPWTISFEAEATTPRGRADRANPSAPAHEADASDTAETIERISHINVRGEVLPLFVGRTSSVPPPPPRRSRLRRVALIAGVLILTAAAGALVSMWFASPSSHRAAHAQEPLSWSSVADYFIEH